MAEIPKLSDQEINDVIKIHPTESELSDYKTKGREHRLLMKRLRDYIEQEFDKQWTLYSPNTNYPPNYRGAILVLDSSTGGYQLFKRTSTSLTGSAPFVNPVTDTAHAYYRPMGGGSSILTAIPYYNPATLYQFGTEPVLVKWIAELEGVPTLRIWSLKDNETNNPNPTDYTLNPAELRVVPGYDAENPWQDVGLDLGGGEGVDLSLYLKKIEAEGVNIKAFDSDTYLTVERIADERKTTVSASNPGEAVKAYIELIRRNNFAQLFSFLEFLGASGLTSYVYQAYQLYDADAGLSQWVVSNGLSGSKTLGGIIINNDTSRSTETDHYTQFIKSASWSEFDSNTGIGKSKTVSLEGIASATAKVLRITIIEDTSGVITSTGYEFRDDGIYRNGVLYGGGGSYTLPIAQPNTLGGIKPDGTTITVDPDTGVASAAGDGSAFDIAALPALPSAVEDTDLFAVNRAGVHYKTTGAALKTFVGSTTTPPSNTPPSITLAANDTDFTDEESILLTATPNDSDGTIAKVEFYEGATLLDTVLSGPYTHAIETPSVGSHSYTARAYDDDNASTVSNVVTINVTAAGAPNLGVAKVTFRWGQSNDSGLSDRTGLTVFQDARAKTWNDQANNGAGAIETYQLGVNDNSINSRQWNGVWIVPSFPPSFGADYSYLQEFLNDPAKAGQTIFSFKPWIGVLEGETISTDSLTTVYWINTMYPKVKAQWDRFKAALLAAGYSSVETVDAFCGLGEGDEDNNLHAQYKANLLTLWNQMLTDGIIQAGTKKYLMLKQPAAYADIRALQLEFVSDNLGYKALEIDNPAFVDGVHYTQASMLAMGVKQYTPEDLISPSVLSLIANFNGVAGVVDIKFNEIVTGSTAGYSIKKNGVNAEITGFGGSGTDTLGLSLHPIAYGDIITLSYDAATGDTTDASGNELVAFTDQPVTNLVGEPSEGAEALSFTTIENLTENPAGTWKPAATGAGAFNLAKGLSGKKLAANSTGRIYATVSGTSETVEAIFMLSASNTNSGWAAASQAAGFYVDGAGTIHRISNGVPTSLALQAPSGYLGVLRDGSTLKLQRSNDAITWIDLHTFSSFTSADDLWPITDIKGDGTGKLVNPMQEGLV